ncbi:DEAD/DEAH box helicase [Cyclobacterium marinum]|uniref:DEAD/DEAH box helicase n=1 Tax=Cyclobacterium marinum TaxID=104 RepID=UPI0011EC13BA|nr:DEAD/DEAH box helicase [Cyclobacterium marinum]MBI0397558.1 DEAD/DEAH box helicase [Cyclobacterium marinum]
MLTEEKRKLTAIGKQEEFQVIFEKLTTNKDLTFSEKSLILATAIIFLKHYENDNRFLSYADLSYYIILKYSLKYGDYNPLFDFSANFGFYPIVSTLINQDLHIENNFTDYLVSSRLEEFRNPKDYIETLEQNLKSQKFLDDLANEKGYLAPTSFGKSSIIVDYLSKNLAANTKVGIIVPTKSLLMQTYQMIRAADLQKRIIMHDEMYSNEDSFIAVFTQERALRLINRKDIFFDILIIDEAHNILKHDGENRQVLLSRLISKNLKANPDQKVIYLSPLIEDIANIRLSENQEIETHKIKFNIKEPEIFELTTDARKYQFNRFINQFYELENGYQNKFKYIIGNSKKKNFIFESSPVRIEKTAKEFAIFLPTINNDPEIVRVIEVLKSEVHEEFYGITYLKHGLIYLHGKLPDIIKEYLESKFRELKNVKFLIANTVILEGINLPFEVLFILNTYRLQGKELINLIGRVNRLNEIFNSDGVELEKLLPRVHFINNKKYTNIHNNKIELLRSRVFKDEVKNPTLQSYDDSKVSENEKEKNTKLKEDEEFLFNPVTNEKDRLKQYLIEAGIIHYYNNIDSFIDSFSYKIINLKNSSPWERLDMLEKINHLFIEGNDISDYEFIRLSNQPARNYYSNYIYRSRKLSFNQRILNQVMYFESLADSLDPQRRKLYFGDTYGEERYDPTIENSKPAYINLRKKDKTEKVNLAVVKLKMEDDFISYKLNKFVIMLYDYQLISKDDYNMFIYGTDDEKKISLTKSGLTINLIFKLDSDDQLKNIDFDPFNNLVANPKFKSYLDNLNDLHRYELNKYIQFTANT